MPQIDLAGQASARGRGVGTLGASLAWAVVFADLGTSVYYVPAILHQQMGGVASGFVLAATIAFVLVALGHIEVAHRYPQGGGGVAAAVEAFGPRAGVISGALMVSAYLIAIALAAVTAMSYLAYIAPQFPYEVLLASILAILAVGALSWWGTRAVARLALVAAIAAVTTQALLAFRITTALPPEALMAAVGSVRRLGSTSGR